jgi:hypothetical protein
MASPLTWTPGPPMMPTADPNELLRRIEKNTADLLWWMKILVAAVVVLVLINALFI